MEQPHAGRAIIHTHPNQVEIIIPSKKNWFLILFISFWMCGWFMGFTFALGTLFTRFQPFMFFWLGAWTVGGAFALNMLISMVFGKEVLIFTDMGRLTQSRKGQLFYKDKTYNLAEARNFRAKESDGMYTDFFGFKRPDFWGVRGGGTIWFNYGMKSVNIANGIDEPEADHILNLLKEKGILTADNFNK